MSKKLKIKFWRTERALAMQVVEQEGLPKQKYNGVIMIINGACLCNKSLYLRGCEETFDFDISSKSFDSNEDRDAYLDKITQSITDELFTSNCELKVGEMCEVVLCNGSWGQRKLLAILPENYSDRYIVDCTNAQSAFYAYSQARPLAKYTEPKIEECGELITYTWEEE